MQRIPIRFKPRLRALCLSLLLIAFPVLAENSLSVVHIISRMDYNAILITEVDIIFVYDQELANNFPYSKADWYRQKYELIATQGQKLAIVTVSIPQGFDSANVVLPEGSAAAIKIYATAVHQPQTAAIHDLTERSQVFIEIDSLGIIISDQ